MTGRRRAVLLLVVQVVLVLSVAGKYLYERWTRPRVWVRTTQVDPEQPLRGRYVALQLVVDACGLPKSEARWTPGYRIYNGGGVGPGSWEWDVSLGAKDGRLMPSTVTHPRSPGEVERLTLVADRPCDRALLAGNEEYFVPEHARGPFSLKLGQELWVEVTVPRSGPPRPVQMAVSGAAGWQPLRFD